jgi:hypothetical protein
MKDPRFAAFYSAVLPGLGQLYLGEKAKGWTLLCMTAGVVVSLIISHTLLNGILMGGIYLAIMIPAATDAFQTASGKPRTFSGDAVPYVIVMLLMVGPFAIPLLWQSPKFSRRGKILWTLGVVLIALLGILFLTFLGSIFESVLGSMSSAA